MPDVLINLNCANCGARLEIHDDMERFACAHCGSEMLVQRRGGTVALRAVTEAIRKVQLGTDKTVAELALVRLEKELLIAKTREQQLLAAHDTRVGNVTVGCAVTVLVGIGSFFAEADAYLFGAVLIVCGVVGFWFGWHHELPKEVGGLRSVMQSTEKRIRELRAIVDS